LAYSFTAASGLLAAHAADHPLNPHQFVITDIGQLGDDALANTAIVQKAIDACAAAGGGQVVVPSGTNATIATIELRSHTDLHLERGAILRASPNHKDFRVLSPFPVNLEPAKPLPPLGVMVFADNSEDIAITGPGTLDGNGSAYITERGKEIYVCPHQRPFTVVLKNCRRVLMRDLIIRDGAFWTVRILGCDDVHVEGIHIINDMLMPNNDGIDVDRARNVRINHCDIRSGDDCISLKASPDGWGVESPCENVIITGCNLTSRSSGVVVGCDVTSPIRDVVVDSCIIKDSHRGLGVRLSLEGSIEHVLFSNIIIDTRMYDDRWWGRSEPIQITSVRWNAERSVGKVSDIHFSNILCRGENGVMVYAEEPDKLAGIEFDRVQVHVDKKTDLPAGHQDLRPKPTDQLPEFATSGFMLRNAADVTFRNCSVTWGEHRDPAYHSVLDAENCPNLASDGLTGDPADPARYPAKSIR
jgi:polygalacturonase